MGKGQENLKLSHTSLNLTFFTKQYCFYSIVFNLIKLNKTERAYFSTHRIKLDKLSKSFSKLNWSREYAAEFGFQITELICQYRIGNRIGNESEEIAFDGK